jgi:hypothetical protein
MFAHSTPLLGGTMRRFAELRRVLIIGAVVLSGGCKGVFGSDGARFQVVISRDGGSQPASNVSADSAGALADHGDENRYLGLWRFQTATVTLSSILVRTEDGELVDLDLDLPIDVDVVKIDGGKQLQLPDGFLPSDTYDQVVLVITAVEGTLRDGTIVTIQPPGGGWTSVIPICPIEVAEGATTAVGIGLNVRGSFLSVGNWWSFQPRFRSLNECDDDSDDDEGHA